MMYGLGASKITRHNIFILFVFDQDSKNTFQQGKLKPCLIWKDIKLSCLVKHVYVSGGNV